jgi:hypothetical protein
MDDLKNTLRVIDKMVADGVIQKYAIAGAVAALNYIEPAVTEDLDILISFEELQYRSSGIVTLEPLNSYLRALGYTEYRKEGIVIEGWPVQFLPVANELDAEALDRAVEVEIEFEGSVPLKASTLSAEHIVATALKVGRPKDRDRILRFFEGKVINFKVLRGIFERHNLLEAWSKFRAQMGLPDLDE